MSLLTSLVDFVKNDLGKLIRYATVSLISVPLGLLLFWLLLPPRTGLAPAVASIIATSIMSIPNYLMNRYWVWNKRGPNSVSREFAPFWAMALLGAFLSTIFVWIADQFTDANLVFLGLNFIAFGMVWVLKFFVLEKFLFGPSTTDPDAEQVSL